MRRGFASEAVRPFLQPKQQSLTFPLQPKSGSSNGLLIGGLAAAAVAGGAYYFLATDATPKERLMELETAGKEAGAVAEAALHMKRKPEDYQKVYNRIAEKLEADDYDGESTLHVYA